MKKDEAKNIVRQSLGLPVVNTIDTFPVEAHLCEFPMYSFSKKRCSVTKIDIKYEDESFCTVFAPLGMPSPTFAGYIDVILYYGQRDLFQSDTVEISVYRIFKTLQLPDSGQLYQRFRKDMRRAFALFIETDRFHSPTGERAHIEYFRILAHMKIAKRHEGLSQFKFDEVFLSSLRSGYLKRLNWDFCLFLDIQGQPLARHIYGHVLKRRGDKSLYQRNLLGFISDIGLGYWLKYSVRKRNVAIREVLYPALNMIKNHAYTAWEIDQDNLIFIP
jgi:hypothetical protein